MRRNMIDTDETSLMLRKWCDWRLVALLSYV